MSGTLRLPREAEGKARKRLVVTADDFGLSPEVNDAVERAHRDGILSAASLMVGAPAAADAVLRARRLPALRVGLHLALVEARPVLPPAAVPHLVGTDGWFRRDTAAYGAAIFFSPAMRREVAAEVLAQFEAFARTGLTLDHVDAHQHFHLHPTVAGALIANGRRHALRAVRVPREPTRLIREIDPAAARLVPAIAAPWTRMLGARLRRAGFVVPDQVFGLAWSGAMTRERLLALLDRLPDGLTEIYTHPATAAGFSGAAPGYRYADELDALMAPAVRAALRRSGASLGGLGDELSG